MPADPALFLTLARLLNASGETVGELAVLCGLEGRDTGAPAAGPGSATRQPAGNPPRPSEAVGDPLHVERTARRVTRWDVATSDILPSRIAARGDDRQVRMEIAPEVPKAPPLELDDEPAEPEAVHPLVPPQYDRTVALTLGSRPTDAGIDVDACLRRMALQEPLPVRLPRRRRLATGGSTDVLLDMSSAMQPFRPDQAALERAFRITLRARVRILRFDASPRLGAGTGWRRTWRPYRPPAAGGRVVVVSDFGGNPLAPRPRPNARIVDEWRAVSGVVQAARCSVVGITPYGRTVPGLRDVLPVVSWGPATIRELHRVLRSRGGV